jgi:hypothetical protein
VGERSRKSGLRYGLRCWVRKYSGILVERTRPVSETDRLLVVKASPSLAGYPFFAILDGWRGVGDPPFRFGREVLWCAARWDDGCSNSLGV